MVKALLTLLIVLGVAAGGFWYFSNLEPTTERPLMQCPSPEILEETCPKLGSPVCGLQTVYCIKAPCPPLQVDFLNYCEACTAPGVTQYAEGLCKK